MKNFNIEEFLIEFNAEPEIDSVFIKYNQELNNTTPYSDLVAMRVWLNEYRHKVNTYTSYTQTILRFSMWLKAFDLSLAGLSREKVQSYHDFLLNPEPTEFWCGPAKPKKHDHLKSDTLVWKPFVKGLSNSSVKLNLQIIKAMYQYLIENGYLTKNPFRLLKVNCVKNKEVEHYLSIKEWGYIEVYINDLPDKTFIQRQHKERVLWLFTLLYKTGLRRSEVTNARMSDFRNKNKYWWLRVLGKGNKYGDIPVTDDLLSALVRYRKFLMLPPYPNSSESHIPLIASKYGELKPLSDKSIYNIIKEICENVSLSIEALDPTSSYTIKQASTHWLRHTSATHQVDAGIDIRIVKDNLRHSLLETTIKYQHTENEKRHTETNDKFSDKRD